MADDASRAALEMEDINLPLDEIINRKANREQFRRPPRGRPFRRQSFQHHRYPPPPPRQDFHQVEPHPILEQTQVPEFQVPPYYQDPAYTPQPYHQWDPRQDTHMTDPNFGPGVVEQSWNPSPHFDPRELEYQVRQQPRKRSYPRGGIRKPTIARRQRTHPRDLPHQSDPPQPKQQDQSILKFENGTTSIVFRGVEIVRVTPTGDVTLTTEGHTESGFLKAMNDVLSLINLEILGEEHLRESWKIKDSRTLFRYYDGISVKGKGEMNKSRAETIRQAFEQPNPKALEATLASNLAARRLGLVFDPMTAPRNSPQFTGAHGMPPNGRSIRITQDQQLTRTSNYSISFLEQDQEPHRGPHNPVYPPPDPISQGGGSMHPY